MKKLFKVVLVTLLFFVFLLGVNAEDKVSVSLDSAPKFNTEEKNGKLNLIVSDTNGLRTSNIKIYKVDKNKKNLFNINYTCSSSDSSKVTCIIDNSYLKDNINYLYISIVDNNGMKNDSYFYVKKKKSGGYSKYFAPKVSSLTASSSTIKYTIADSSSIKTFIITDLNSKKVIVSKNNSGTSITNTLLLSNLTSVGGKYSFEIYTEDSEGNSARRTYTVTIVTLKNAVAVKENAPSISKDKVLKVLLIGNSYTYYNDYGGILAELARKQGRKMIVVNAVHGGRDVYCIDALEVSVYSWNNMKDSSLNKKHNSFYSTSLLQKLSKNKSLSEFQRDKDKVKNYNLKLKDAINYDWGGLNRAGKWDYVVLQNHYKGEKGALKKAGISVKKYCNYGPSKRKTYEKKDSASQYTTYVNESNVMIYNMVANGLSSKSNFIVLRTFAVDWPSHTSGNNYMKKSAKENGFSFVDTRMLAKAIVGDSKEARLNTFTTLDSSEHPAPRGAYLMATAVYARIFGIDELASSTNSTNFIKLYNLNGRNSFEGAVTQALFSTGGGKTVTKNGKKVEVYNTAKSYAMSVSESDAKKIQLTVYNNFNKYIKIFS